MDGKKEIAIVLLVKGRFAVEWLYRTGHRVCTLVIYAIPYVIYYVLVRMITFLHSLLQTS